MEIPNEDVTPDDIHPGADLVGVDLSRADLSGENLQDADFSGANLEMADLTDVDLRGAILTDALLHAADLERAALSGADLTNASLYQTRLADTILDDANLTGANLREASLFRASLAGADLTDADLSGADLTGIYLRDTDLSNTTVTPETRINQLKRTEEEAVTSHDWNQIAKIYRDLESVFRNNGLYDTADYYRSLSRRAEGFGAKASGGLLGYLGYFEILSYRILFEIGVTRVVSLMVILYVVSTSWYISAGIEDPFYYSIVVFTTSPSAAQAPSTFMTKMIVILETFLGTLLIVLLGAVISSRL